MDNKINIDNFKQLLYWTKDKETKDNIKSIINMLSNKSTF
jgi:hypothetical protein